MGIWSLLAGLDGKHAVLAVLIPVAFLVGRTLARSPAMRLLEEGLRAAGHPHVALALDLLSRKFSEIATDAEKSALARSAAEEGVSHPAIKNAAGGRGL